DTVTLHDALPISPCLLVHLVGGEHLQVRARRAGELGELVQRLAVHRGHRTATPLPDAGDDDVGRIAHRLRAHGPGPAQRRPGRSARRTRPCLWSTISTRAW